MCRVQRCQRLLTGLADLLELLYMVTGRSQVNFGYLERSTSNKREYVTPRIASRRTYRRSATSASSCCSRDPPSALTRWVAPLTAEDLRSYTASLSASPCCLRESSSTRCSRCVLLVSALTSDVRVSCRSCAFAGEDFRSCNER